MYPHLQSDVQLRLWALWIATRMVFGLQDRVPAPRDPVLAPQDPVLGFQDRVPAGRDPFLELQDGLPAHGDPVLELPDGVPARRDPVLAPEASLRGKAWGRGGEWEGCAWMGIHGLVVRWVLGSPPTPAHHMTSRRWLVGGWVLG